MRKVIAAINMTVDGVCDHRQGIADDELHQHYSDLIRGGGVILYGRKTYQLMEYWRTVLENPTGNKSNDEFAEAIDNIPKIVFSRTLENVDWETASLSKKELREEITGLKQEAGRDIMIGSRSLIVQGLNLGLVDEFQLCIHPMIAGEGLLLFDEIDKKVNLKLTNIKRFGSGAIILYYEPEK
jgi:dihydrofolate reductase